MKKNEALPTDPQSPSRPPGFPLNRRRLLQSLLGLGAGGGALLAGAKLSTIHAASHPEAGTMQPGQGNPPHNGTHTTGHGEYLVKERFTEAGIAALTARVKPLRPKNPMEALTSFDSGTVTRLADGTVQREYVMIAEDAEIEVAKGVKYPAWTYNGFVPGPTIRATEGDRLKIHFFNKGSVPHTVHFHGIHAASMDGVFEMVPVGGKFTYEFTAEPFGAHLYHCHTMPLKKHIEKGLYGAFIVDPRTPRPPAKELVMVMNGYDTDMDGENEFYTVNGVANYFLDNPIPLRAGEPVRIYLVNLTEFDLLNSIHIHAQFFKLYRTGTRLDQHEITDTVILAQGERAVLEFAYNIPGRYMFHAHQSEFAELGWMGFFNVQGPSI
ncbi:MAG: multicopper oxidase domain-containing protein [Candidatus Tectomicrobia bacterium]|nr:multicopper oxidase domain-containing protein [Candidatus Tectomicrobia bacterium]